MIRRSSSSPNEVQVEVVGRKQAGYIPADELSATGANPADLVNIGDELDLLIMRTNEDVYKRQDRELFAGLREPVCRG